MAERIATRSDCSRCAALCCIAYPSDDMPGFSARKAAGEPCPNLDACGACRTYERREQEGFAGCVSYECFGAGQHVVQTLFAGRDWRDDPALLQPMVGAFLAMRPVSDLLFLADRALAKAGPDVAVQLSALRAELEDLAAARAGLDDGPRLERASTALRAIYARLDATVPGFRTVGRTV
jgi:hypothetical protein